MIERTIQTVKGTFIKAIQTKEDPFLAILNHNATPKQDLPAPCTLLMGKKIRSILPISKDSLKPLYHLRGIKTKLQLKQRQ